MPEEHVAEFQKNATELVRARIGEYSGHKFVDIRIFYAEEDTGEPKPTKKGVTFSPQRWPQFKEMVDALERELDRQGLIEQAATEG